jgi:hypothetical protein
VAHDCSSSSLLLAATASFFSQQGRLGAQAAATEQDALLGSWQLDLAKSRYVPGPPPRSETRTYVRDKDGVQGTIRRQRDDGREEVIEYRADFDREFPVMGTEAYDTIRLKRIDARTAGSCTFSCRSRFWHRASRRLGRRPHADDHVPPGGSWPPREQHRGLPEEMRAL